MSDKDQNDRTNAALTQYRLVKPEKAISEWVPALEAVDIVRSGLGTDEAAKSALIGALAAGTTQTRVDVILQEADIGTLDLDEFHWGQKPKKHLHQSDDIIIEYSGGEGAYLELPESYFASAEGWLIDESSISWPDGRLTATRPAVISPAHVEEYPAGARIRRAVEDLHFDRSFIEGLAGIQPKEHKEPARGVMPLSAKAVVRRHEEFAHQAAVIVVQRKCLPEAAFREVAPTDPEIIANRDPPSVRRAIRRAYNLMYHKDGRPKLE